MVKHRIHTWNDVLSILLRRGSVEEQKIARRKLEQKIHQRGEDIMDYAASCLDLLRRPGQAIKEGLNVSPLTISCEDCLISWQIELNFVSRDTENIWQLAQYVSEQAEKLKSREISKRTNAIIEPNPMFPSRQLSDTAHTSGITCYSCGEQGHLARHCTRYRPQHQAIKANHQSSQYYNVDEELSQSPLTSSVAAKLNGVYQHYIYCDHNNTWNEMTQDEREKITANIETSKAYINHQLQQDSSIDGYIMKKLLLKPVQIPSVPSASYSETVSEENDPSTEFMYGVETFNRFEILDNLEREISSPPVSPDQQQYLHSKPRFKQLNSTRNNRVKKSSQSSVSDHNVKYSRVSYEDRKVNHLAACRRLESKISSMNFDEIIDYCTSRVLSPNIKRLVISYHPYIFDVLWIDNNRSPAAYLAYLCVSNHVQSKYDALAYCLNLKIETSEAATYISSKFSTGWLKDLTRDGDVEANPGPIYLSSMVMQLLLIMSFIC